jgi:NAD(P)H-hydrate repair Nnr-like enzyme with NAD(P)H-hydrate dehydratase domain
MTGLLVAGTMPTEAGRVYEGPVTRGDDGSLVVGGEVLPGCQGTGALLLAAVAACEHGGAEPPYGLLAGDIGRGEGTRAIFSRLPARADEIRPRVIEFHYLQPIMALMRQAVADLACRVADGTLLVADAGGMYAARASGVGAAFELMTPDVGEVGFLADETVSHPAYVSHYLFGTQGFDAVALAVKAQQGASARVLLVKGATDYVIEAGEVVGSVSEPVIPALEAIGGTGDTLAGLVSGLMATGMPTVEAALIAARANREAGRLLGARPYHTPSDLADHFRGALALASA